jgi:hypothetical protein
VNLRPSNPYEKIENCSYAIRLCLDLKFSLVGINGKNLFEGNRKLTLGNQFSNALNLAFPPF